MRTKVKMSVMIECCAQRIAALTARLEELEMDQTEGAWRDELAQEIGALADEVAETEITGEEIASKLYNMRNIAKAEGMSHDIARLKRDIFKVERIQGLCARSSADGYMVDSTDPFLMSIIMPETKEED